MPQLEKALLKSGSGFLRICPDAPGLCLRTRYLDPAVTAHVHIGTTRNERQARLYLTLSASSTEMPRLRLHERPDPGDRERGTDAGMLTS